LALRDGKPLLNADDPIIDQRKFKDYALNENSPDPKARSKAEVFRKTLGYTADNSASLEAQIRASLPDAKAKLGVTDKWGTRFEVDTQVTGPNGVTKTVRSAWIYDPGSSQPRMVTVYVK
jgi:filamentous hemagglutinin